MHAVRVPSRLTLLAGIAAVTLVSGCAEVSIYSTPDLGGPRTGIPFYSPKPYLLVARTGAKDKPVDVSVIYLPDLSKPLYVRLNPGLWGSSDLSVTFSNGIMTTVGHKSDVKLPELLTAVGGLQTALANASKTRAETDLLGNESAPDLGPLAAKLTALANDLDKQIAFATEANVLTTVERDALSVIIGSVKAASSKLADPTQAQATLAETVATLKMAAKNWDGQVKGASPATSGSELTVRRQITTLRGQLQEVIDQLSPKPGDPPTFTLYEMNMTPTGTTLTEVKF